jgi:hypothetical protein
MWWLVVVCSYLALVGLLREDNYKKKGALPLQLLA